MKSRFYTLIIITISIFSEINALPSVAICGWDGGTGDELSFVALRDFTAGEIIYFTEDEYSDFSNNFNIGEGHFAYTVPAGGLSENEVVVVTESSTNTYSVLCGAGGTATHVTGTGSWSFSNTDELYAYSASNPASPWNSITEIHCFIYAAVILPPTDQDPTNDYPNTIVVMINLGAGGGMAGDFKDSERTNTTIPDFQNPANWNTSSSDITLSCMDFVNHLLPIDLVSFDAKQMRNSVELKWTTANEINNEGFEIEHSMDGQSFNKIATIKGNGTTYQTSEYSLIHRTPDHGTNYYRLKQMDYDGGFSYSDIESVRYTREEKISAIYPNPFQNQVTIEFSESDVNFTTIGSRKIEIFDNFGKLVLTQEASNDMKNIILDLSTLNEGVYFVKYLEGGLLSSAIQRVVKM